MVVADPITQQAIAIAIARRKLDNASLGLPLLEWSERYRFFNGQPMRVPGPLREIYRTDAHKIVVMKGAQLGFSEWAINLMLWAADTGYANRGTALYVQPTGGSAGDFVQGRVNPAFDASEYLASRVGKATNSKDPDKVGLRKIGRGYTYWRTAKSRSGLKSVPADILVLDEYDEMPPGTLSLASHRLDSSEAPITAILSTPSYPGVGVDPEYLAGDQRRYLITCECGTEQALDWERNVVDLVRVCVDCRESIEGAIQDAWDNDTGRWQPTADGDYPSYHLSQLYRPEANLAEIHAGITSSDVTKQQEAWNQHLGLPFSPPGGQLSMEELRRLCDAPFTLAQVAGVQGCWMGVDIGARMHCWIAWDSDRYGPAKRYLVGAYEADDWDGVASLMDRFGVTTCVVDAHPELHGAREFQRRYWGRVWLCTYVKDRMPPQYTLDDETDPKQMFRVTVDRTGAMDALAGQLRGGDVSFASDAEGVPGLFAMLQAPVRRLETSATTGMTTARYDEGSRPDHYYHAAVYAELAAHIGARMPIRGSLTPQSHLGAYERDIRL